MTKAIDDLIIFRDNLRELEIEVIDVYIEKIKQLEEENRKLKESNESMFRFIDEMMSKRREG